MQWIKKYIQHSFGPWCIKSHVYILGGDLINCPTSFQSICLTNSQIYRSDCCPFNPIMIALVDVFALCFYFFLLQRADCIADLIMLGRGLALLSWGSLLAMPSQYHGLVIQKLLQMFKKTYAYRLYSHSGLA